ncbi:MAG: diguanylate cyclase [Erysipelothrix sp.]|nr:diguanylate cyclase [Erysipelothrix sp.]
MLIGFDTLILVMIISVFAQNITIEVQNQVMKSRTPRPYWLLSSILASIGYISLLLVDVISTEPILIFVAAFIFVLADVLKLKGVQREFTNGYNNDENLLLKILPILYGVALFISIYILKDLRVTIILIFSIRIISSLCGLWMISSYRKLSLMMSKVLLTIIFIVMFISNIYIIVRVVLANSYAGIFGGQDIFVYSYELVKSLLWSLTILTLNVSQVEMEKDENLVKYETLFNVNPDVQLIVSEDDLTVIEVNDSFVDISGIRRDDIVGKSVEEVPLLKRISDQIDYYSKVIDGTLNNSVEIRQNLKGGKQFVGLLNYNRFTIKEKPVILNSLKDVSDSKHFQRLNEILSDVVRQNPIAIVVTELDGKIIFVNDQFTQMTGYTQADTAGNTPRILKSGQKDVAYYQNLWDTVLSGEVWQGEIINRRKDGSFYWEKNRILPVKNENGKLMAFVSMKDDITKSKQTEESLTLKASIDGLTGVNNYSHFMELFEKQMDREWQEGQTNALLMIDIDDFKIINDSWGHMFADKILKSLAEYLGKSLRNYDVLGRLGGEEFGILVENVNKKVAKSIADRICHEVSEMAFITDTNEEVHVTVSIGVNVYDNADDIYQIMKEADDAMYVSKRMGKNQVTMV